MQACFLLQEMFAVKKSSQNAICSFPVSLCYLRVQSFKYCISIFQKQSKHELLCATLNSSVKGSLGPRLFTFKKEISVVSKTGVLVSICHVKSASEALLTLLTTYYLLDLTYPASFGQLLGLLQIVCLQDNFLSGSKKLLQFINKNL